MVDPSDPKPVTPDDAVPAASGQRDAETTPADRPAPGQPDEPAMEQANATGPVPNPAHQDPDPAPPAPEPQHPDPTPPASPPTEPAAASPEPGAAIPPPAAGEPATGSPGPAREPAGWGAPAAQPGPAVPGGTGGPAAPLGGPPVRRRRRGVLVGVLAAVVVVLLVAAGVAAMPVYRALFVPPPTERVLSALDRLSGTPMVRYRGGASVGASRSGAVQRLDLRVATDGTALGGLTRPSGRADLLARDGKMYLRGDRKWLLATDPTKAGYLTGHWQTADADDVGLPVSALTPRKLAKTLRSGLRAGATARKHQAVEHRLNRAARVRGERVVPYTLPSDAVVYLSSTAPYTVLGADVRAGDGYLSLDLDAGTDRDRTTLRHDTARRAEGLAGDLDPAEPAHYLVTNISAGDCGMKTCTLKVTVVVGEGEDTSRGGYVVGVFGREGGEPADLGTCMTKLPKMTPGHAVRVSCTDRSRAYAEWPGGSGFTGHIIPFSPGLEGTDPKTKLDLYRHPGYDEAMQSASYPDVESPGEAIGLLNRLLDTVDWSASEAITAVQGIIGSGALGPITDLMSGGALEARPGMDVSHDQAASYVEAARRVKAGSKHVAVGSWTSHSRPYSADVVDISGRRLVWLGHTDSTKLATTVKDVRSALSEAGHRPVPSRFSREVRVTIGTRSALYRMGRDSLLTELRLGGITRSTMAGVGRLTVVAGPGTYTYRPSDFD